MELDVDVSEDESDETALEGVSARLKVENPMLRDSVHAGPTADLE